MNQRSQKKPIKIQTDLFVNMAVGPLTSSFSIDWDFIKLIITELHKTMVKRKVKGDFFMEDPTSIGSQNTLAHLNLIPPLLHANKLRCHVK